MAKNLVLNRSRKVPAEDTAAFGAIAERFRRAGALERAVTLCREGLQKFPDHISARVTLGWALLDLGQYDDARVELEQVLRRAPDNLAAIRGLAELHDRFEHTLQLPMDGPGQWPPPPESMDDSAAPGRDAGSDDVISPIPEMAPAALGIPIFSPSASSTPVPAPPLAHATAAGAPVPESPTPPAQCVEPAPLVAAARAAAEPLLAEPAAAGSGMGEIGFPTAAPASLPGPVVEKPTVAAVEFREIRAESNEIAADGYAVLDADLRALLAESESLDDAATAASIRQSIAAEATPAAPAFSSITDPISIDFDLDAAPVQIVAPTALGIVGPMSNVDETVPGEVAASFAGYEVAAPEPVPGASPIEEAPVLTPAFVIEEPVFVAEDSVISGAMEAEEVFEDALEIAAPIVEAALLIEEAELVPEPATSDSAAGGSLEAQEVFEAALEIAPIVEAALLIEEPELVSAPAASDSAAGGLLEAQEVFEAALEIASPIVEAALVIEQPELLSVAAIRHSPTRDTLETEEVFEAALEIAVPIVEAAIELPEPAPESAPELELAAEPAAAEIISIQTARAIPRSPVPALERFLTKVQARRAQLMTESVA
jgi:tetratricopeptide (TPR) repeat protein